MPVDVAQQQQFDALLSKVKDLYGTKKYDRSPRITEGLKERFATVSKVGDVSEMDRFLNTLGNIFEEREVVKKQRDNVVRQMAEIDESVFSPQKITISKWLDQSRARGEHESVEAIKDSKTPITHLSVPSGGYRQKVMLAGFETQGAVDANLVRLNSIIDTGDDISWQQQEKIRNIKPRNQKYCETAAQVGAGIHKIFEQAGKGLYSSTDAADLSFVHEYNLKRQQLAQSLREKLNAGHSNYSILMEKLLSKIKNSTDIHDIASYNQMKEALEKEIKDDEAEYKIRMDKFDKDMKDSAEAMLKDMQSDADESDKMWKYRVLSLFLIFTPLGAFSIAGHVFNYLDPLKQFLGPLLDAHKGLGEGFADMITDKKTFGFLGEFMDIIEVDKAIEGIFDLPIIDDLDKIVSYAKNSDIGQEVLGTAFQMSTLGILGIGAVTALKQGAWEADHMKSSKEKKDKHMKALDSSFSDLEKDIASGWEKKRDDDSKEKHVGTDDLISKLVDKRYGTASEKDAAKKYGILPNADLDIRMCKFFLRNMNKPEMKPMLDQVFAGFDVHKDHFRDERGRPSAKVMLKYLNGDSTTKADFDKIKAAARSKFLLVGAIDANVITNGKLSKTPEQVQDEFATLTQASQKEQMEKKIAEAREKFSHEYYFDTAKKERMQFDRTKEGAESIETRLKEKERKTMKYDLPRKTLPTTSMRPSPIVHAPMLAHPKSPYHSALPPAPPIFSH
jgi:hypothetical protein